MIIFFCKQNLGIVAHNEPFLKHINNLKILQKISMHPALYIKSRKADYHDIIMPNI